MRVRNRRQFVAHRIWVEESETMDAKTDAKTILVVDDDRELNDGLREVLVREGYRVIQANNGIQAKEIVYRDRPDLVILDMMMPRMGGFPVLEHFRGKSDAPPIIMMTANEGSRHKAYAEMLGVVKYIRKPFPMEVLLETVARCFGTEQKTEDEDE
jgi:DNA-binding response OmpR family regulator